MQDNNIGNIPISEENKEGYRNHISSNERNKRNKDFLNDILNLYNKSNSLEKKCNNAIDILSTENLFLKSYIDSLTANIENLKNNISKDSPTKTLIVYGHEAYTESSPAIVDKITSNITLSPKTSISKLRIENNEEKIILIPNSLEYEINDYDNKHIIKVEDNDFTNCINDNMEDIFVRKVTTDETINKIDMYVTITIPEKIVTSYDINEISIYPYPSNTCNLDNIEYRISNGSFETIPSFNDHNRITDNSINNYGPIKFNFKKINANQIRIAVSQNQYIQEGNNRIFYLGFKKIDIRSLEYVSNDNNFVFDIDIPENITSPMIVSVEEVYNNSSQIKSKSVQYEFFYYDKDNLLHKINDSLPFKCPSRKIVAKCKLYYNHLTTPNIEKFIVTYKDAD